MNKQFQKLCTPAKLYFAVTVLSAIFALFNSVPILAVFMKIIFAFIWTFVLNWLCSKGLTTLSWIIVLLPYLILVMVSLNIFKMTKENMMM